MKFLLRVCALLALAASSWAAPPQRIVSLLPSLTESVCALGACERLVAVDRYSNTPDSIQKLPRVGGGLDPEIEAIVALKPDLVLIAKSSPAIARLQSLGLNVVVLEPQSHAEVRASLLQLDGILGMQRAEKLWQQIEQELDAASAGVPAALRGASIYFEVNRGPWAAGETSFIGQTLKRMGLRNIVDAKLGAFPKLNPEYVVQSNPKVILTGESSMAEMKSRPGWARLDALVAGRVCVFTPTESDALLRAGPRMAEAARLLLQCLRTVPQ